MQKVVCDPAHFFFNATPPPDIYTLSLHDALPISRCRARALAAAWPVCDHRRTARRSVERGVRGPGGRREIGRASCRERVQISVVGLSVKITVHLPRSSLATRPSSSPLPHSVSLTR